MYSVLRDGIYTITDTKLFGDLEVPEKPHEYCVFINDEWVLDANAYFNSLDKDEAELFLKNTAEQVSLYREEKDLGIETTLSESEYLELIAKRRERREILNEFIN
ncbi:TPA: hypothetical protein IAD41_07665 [Candidatus Scatenecus faecavium]|uniref:Uncharacterized protein n=1 Tax=Candidatus Scatenecus faecavium TaxID=2840915 RepID=A0A9D1FXD3_9BACT|nr:hypothetical protein [Candidatus Scatenecus faecavium]